MKKIRVLAASAALVLALCAAGCGGSGGNDGSVAEYESTNDDKLVALVQSSNGGTIEEKNGMLYAEVAVKMPDFQALMEKHHEEAEQNASDGNDYERRLYDLVYNDPAVHNAQVEFVTINLSRIDPEKTDWTDDEIRKLAQQAAFDEAADQFAIEMIQKNETYLQEVSAS